MSTDENNKQRFYEGDKITIRGNVYVVEQVDRLPSGEILQYRLDAQEDGLAGTLKVHDSGEYVIAEYYDIDGEEITVIE